MKKLSFIVAIGLTVLMSCNKKAQEVKLVTQLDSVSYALGVNVGESMANQEVKDLNAEFIKSGFEAALIDSNKNILISKEDAYAVLQKFFMNKQKEKTEKNLKEGQAFLEKNKKESGIIVTASGLQYKILKTGTGPMPKATDNVTVHYTGKLIDGSTFESTEGKEPASFPVNGVIPGWIEALQLMPVGSKWTLYIPTELAYGANPRGGAIQPNAALVFDIELLSINPPAKEEKTKIGK